MIDKFIYEVDYGKKVKQAEELLNYLASCSSTYVSLTNPGDKPVQIRCGCKITFIKITDVGYLSPEEQEEYERILDEQYNDTGININELV